MTKNIKKKILFTLMVACISSKISAMMTTASRQASIIGRKTGPVIGSAMPGYLNQGNNGAINQYNFTPKYGSMSTSDITAPNLITDNSSNLYSQALVAHQIAKSQQPIVDLDKAFNNDESDQNDEMQYNLNPRLSIAQNLYGKNSPFGMQRRNFSTDAQQPTLSKANPEDKSNIYQDDYRIEQSYTVGSYKQDGTPDWSNRILAPKIRVYTDKINGNEYMLDSTDGKGADFKIYTDSFKYKKNHDNAVKIYNIITGLDRDGLKTRKDISENITPEHMQKIEKLILSGIDPNEKIKHRSLFLEACKLSRQNSNDDPNYLKNELIQALLTAGANPLERDTDGNNALFLIIENYRGEKIDDLIQIFLDKGIDVNQSGRATTSDFRFQTVTPLELMLKKYEIYKNFPQPALNAKSAIDVLRQAGAQEPVIQIAQKAPASQESSTQENSVMSKFKSWF